MTDYDKKIKDLELETAKVCGLLNEKSKIQDRQIENLNKQIRVLEDRMNEVIENQGFC